MSALVKWQDRSESVLTTLNRRRDSARMYTPDYQELKRDIMIPLFVYGTLKQGFAGNNILNGSAYLGEGETVTTHWMKKHSSSKYPIVYEGTRSSLEKSYAPIRGEIYYVHPQTLLEVDFYEQNQYLFQRKPTMIWATSQKRSYGMYIQEARPAVKCWMYFAGVDFLKTNEGMSIPMTYDDTTKKEFYEW